MPQVPQVNPKQDTRAAIYLACSALAYMAGTEQPVPTDPMEAIQKKMCSAVIALNNSGAGLVRYVTSPTTPTSPGVHPSIAVAAPYLYYTTADNQWLRVMGGAW